MKKGFFSLALVLPHLVLASAESDFTDVPHTSNIGVVSLPLMDASMDDLQILTGRPVSELMTFDEYKSTRASDEIMTHFLTEFMGCDLEAHSEKIAEKDLFCGHVAFWTVINGFAALDADEEKVKDLFVQQGVDHMVAMSIAQLPFTKSGFQQLITFQNALAEAGDASFDDLNESYLVLTNVGLTETQQKDAIFTALATHFSKNSPQKDYFHDAQFKDLFESCYDYLSEIMLHGYGLIKAENITSDSESNDDSISDEEYPTRIIVDEQRDMPSLNEAYANHVHVLETTQNIADSIGGAPAA